MADELQRFEEDTLTAGVNVNTRDFSARMELSENTYNLTMGINKGLGPRYGVAPIPGQQDTEASAAGPVGLRQTEGAGNGFSYNNRVRVYAVFSIVEYFPGTGQSSPMTYYVWVVGSVQSGTPRVDFLISSTKSTTFTYPDPEISSGVNYAIMPGNTDTFSELNPAFFHLIFSGDDPQVVMADLFSGYSKNYMSCAQLSVTGIDVDCNWIAFYNQAGPGAGNGNATRTCNGNVNFTPGVHCYGPASAINLSNVSTVNRSLKFYNIYGDPTFGNGMSYAYNYANTAVPSGTYLPALDFNFTTNLLDLTKITFTSKENRFDGTTPAFANAADVGILLYDPNMTTNTSFQAIFMAANKPLCAIIQGWNRSKFGYPFSFVDLTSQRFKPQSTATIDMYLAGSNLYKEDGVVASTGWNSWPSFVTGTPLENTFTNPRTVATFTHQMALGNAGSGVLRKNTVYEFTYSIYDKLLNFESNVGEPAKIQTGADDFVAIALYRDIDQSGNWHQTIVPPIGGIFRNYDVVPGSGNLRGYPMNYLTYRVYYRQLGSYEWLPAAEVDSAQYRLYPNWQSGFWACRDSIAALPGGQPGGFNDYSELPKDTYIDVKTFQGRTFWCSAKNIYFSYRNNPFAYAGRNSIAAPTGEFKGMIVHMFFGQSEQTGRLVIFGTKETYAGTFTGSPLTQPIQIDPNTVGNYPVDGSDFQINSRTTVTAFSSRAAVVAEGNLFWWGPQGIYHDDGVNIPQKISQRLEPLIYNLYDPNSTDEIHCNYNYQTKEVIWFYNAKGDTSGTTSQLIYNYQENAFYPGKDDCKVDASQQINTTSPDADLSTSGQRTLIFSRANASSTIQRAYFFDQNNRSGDMKPGTEFMVKTVGVLANNQIIVTLASGFDAAAFAAIAPGQQFCFSQVADYTGQSSTVAPDIITTVVSTASPTITLAVPTSVVSYFSGTLARNKLFPIYNSVQNAIPYVMETRIWTPGGMRFWAYWLFCHLFFKIKLLADTLPLKLNFSYRTPVSGPDQTNVLTLTDNSLGNCQIYTSLKNIKRTHDGQGVKLTISGSHFGSQWVLQYLAMDANPQIYDEPKEFEG